MNKTLEIFGLIVLLVAAYISGVLSHPLSIFLDSENDYLSEINEIDNDHKIDEDSQTNS